MPAGGFCRRSAAAQWALAQEMSRQLAGASEEDEFDCAEHDWPELFKMDLFDDDSSDFGFDFELIDGEDDDDAFVLEMMEDDGDADLDGEWANIMPATAVQATTTEAGAERPDAARWVADITAAANALNLDFRKAVRRQVVPTMSRNASTVTRAAAESVDDWPLLAGAPATSLASSPTSVADVTGQWVSVVEKSRETSEDKMKRNLRDKCRRTLAQIRRAEKKELKVARKEPVPAEEFPPLSL